MKYWHRCETQVFNPKKKVLFKFAKWSRCKEDGTVFFEGKWYCFAHYMGMLQERKQEEK